MAECGINYGNWRLAVKMRTFVGTVEPWYKVIGFFGNTLVGLHIAFLHGL